MKSTLILGFVIFFLIAQSVFARSGCCSHHGGVMSNGCGCNDGTPLSDTCAPYYSCGGSTQVATPNVYPTSTPYTQATIAPTRIPTRIPTKIPTSTPTKAPAKSLTKSATSTPSQSSTLKPTNAPSTKSVQKVIKTEPVKSQGILEYLLSLLRLGSR